MTQAASILREARTAAGITQSELARRLGTTQPAIARLERPGSNPTIDMLQRALTATGHRLHVAATRMPVGLDEAQMTGHLRMNPAERLAAHSASRRKMRELIARARPSVDDVG